MATYQYFSALGSYLDQISFFLVYPWATALSHAIACYIPTSQPTTWFTKILEKLFLGPACFTVFLLFFPIGFTGVTLWVFLCTIFPQKKFSYLCISKKQLKEKDQTDKQIFTLTTANVLLANEAFSRINNIRNPMGRSKLIGSQLLNQTPSPLSNLVIKSSHSKEDFIMSDLPDTDIFCIQEVWERYWAAAIIDQLQKKYNYFIHDIGDFRLLSNFCLFGSGLFVASKYPIEAADFQAFQCRNSYARIFSYGVLCLKVRIQGTKVAYIANVHCQAYQGKETIIYHQLSETLGAINAFQQKHQQVEDEIVFDSICGDLNFDNMSPGDAYTQRHPILNQYTDVCSIKSGEDHPWTVGTELRQLRMHEAAVKNPENLRNVLIDDCKRRHYVLDANVMEHTLALASVDPVSNEKGEIQAEKWGGKRRIDRILIRRDYPVTVNGYAFSSVLSGLTDHIPASISFQIRK